MSWVFSLLATIFSQSFKIFLDAEISKREAEKAGAQAQELKAETDANAVVAKAKAAEDAVAAEPLLPFELHDPNNRDNAATASGV